MACVNVFEDVTRNPMSAVGASYKNEDLFKVWTELAKQIIHTLKDSKGVTVKGLGTFTLSNWSLETGNNKRTLDFWRPVFTMSKSLQEAYDLHQPKQYVNDAIPLAPICLQDLVKVSQLSKEKVFGCIDELILCFRRLLSEGKNVKFPLEPLGQLKVIDTIVFFEFRNTCKPITTKPPGPCVKYALARTSYTKKYTVPCNGHSKKTF